MSQLIHLDGRRLGDFFNQRQEPGRSDLPVMSVTMNDSLVLRDDLERRMESALQPEQHLLVRKGDIAYNMMRMWQGACGLAMADGMVSPAYVVLDGLPGILKWPTSAVCFGPLWAKRTSSLDLSDELGSGGGVGLESQGGVI